MASLSRSIIRELNYVVRKSLGVLGFGTHNPAHFREWSFVEFEAYVRSHFDILEHFISNSAQATQCILCSPRRTA
jgi:hypothetical protein